MPALPQKTLTEAMSDRIASCQTCADLSIANAEINATMSQMIADLNAQMMLLQPIYEIKDLSLSNVGDVASALKDLAAYIAGPYTEYQIKTAEYAASLAALQIEIAAKISSLGCS
jgi:hypothetical protein